MLLFNTAVLPDVLIFFEGLQYLIIRCQMINHHRSLRVLIILMNDVRAVVSVLGLGRSASTISTTRCVDLLQNTYAIRTTLLRGLLIIIVLGEILIVPTMMVRLSQILRGGRWSVENNTFFLGRRDCDVSAYTRGTLIILRACVIEGASSSYLSEIQRIIRLFPIIV